MKGDREMKLHLRADSVDTFHVRFTVFMNGANCGQLCMTDDEARFFHDVIITTKYKLREDEVYSSGQWFLEKTKNDENKGDLT